VLARLAVMCAVVAPGTLPITLPILASGFALGAVPLTLRQRAAMRMPKFEVPELSNPTQLHVALGFGAMYAFVLLGSAWLSERAGSQGLYAMAVASGLADIDAITLSSLNLFNTGRAGAAVAATAIGLAFTASVAFKLGVLLFAGGRVLLKDCAAALLTPVAGIAAGILFFT
jgi:uncharacterized membrane protein (DUF4010 family)